MKRFFIIIFVLVSLTNQAQKISVEECTEQFNIAERNALKTTIYENTLTDVVAEWTSYLLINKCARITNDQVEIYAHNVFLKEIVNKPIDLYCRFVKDTVTKTISMKVALDMGAGNYLKSQSNPVEFKLFEKTIRSFAFKTTKAPIQAYLLAAVNYQKKLHEEITIIEKNKLKIEDNITHYKNKIIKAEQKLVAKKAEHETKSNEVITQKKLNDTITDVASERAKAAKKTIDKLTNQKKNIEEDLSNIQKNIEEYQNKILNYETKIKSGEGMKTFNLKEIESHKLIEDKWKKKLNEITE